MTPFKYTVFVIAIATMVIGCQKNGPDDASPSTQQGSNGTNEPNRAGRDLAKEPKIIQALAKLSSIDREQAEAQKYCAILNQNLLGSMGTPVKIEIKGEAVFLCCDGCKDKALSNADDTLAKVAKLKTENVHGN